MSVELKSMNVINQMRNKDFNADNYVLQFNGQLKDQSNKVEVWKNEALNIGKFVKENPKFFEGRDEKIFLNNLQSLFQANCAQRNQLELFCLYAKGKSVGSPVNCQTQEPQKPATLFGFQLPSFFN